MDNNDTINVTQQRQLIQKTREMMQIINQREFTQIMCIYIRALNRLIKEQEDNEEDGLI